MGPLCGSRGPEGAGPGETGGVSEKQGGSRAGHGSRTRYRWPWAFFWKRLSPRTLSRAARTGRSFAVVRPSSGRNPTLRRPVGFHGTSRAPKPRGSTDGVPLSPAPREAGRGKHAAASAAPLVAKESFPTVVVVGRPYPRSHCQHHLGSEAGFAAEAAGPAGLQASRKPGDEDAVPCEGCPGVRRGVLGVRSREGLIKRGRRPNEGPTTAISARR